MDELPKFDTMDLTYVSGGHPIKKIPVYRVFIMSNSSGNHLVLISKLLSQGFWTVIIILYMNS